LVALASSLLAPCEALAVGDEHTNTYGKGIVGGGLIGAEVTVLVEAALGVKNPWYYALGGGLGMVAGGVGGFFIAQASGESPVPMTLLTVGLVGAIPTTIAVLSATQYRPEQDQAMTSALVRPRGLIQYSPVGYSLTFPQVQIREVFSPKEKVTYALPSATEFRTVVFSAEF
jgi:hypothetical protein